MVSKEKEIIVLTFWDKVFILGTVALLIGAPVYLIYDWWTNREPVYTNSTISSQPVEPSQLDRIEKDIKDIRRKELYQ